MGFLDNLLKRETRKIISGAVDSVVDNVVDNIKGAIRGSNSSSEAKSSPNVSIKVNGRTIMEHGRENETGDDADCCLKGQTLIQNKPSVLEGYFSASLEKALFCGLSCNSSFSDICLGFPHFYESGKYFEYCGYAVLADAHPSAGNMGEMQ